MIRVDFHPISIVCVRARGVGSEGVCMSFCALEINTATVIQPVIVIVTE